MLNKSADPVPPKGLNFEASIENIVLSHTDSAGMLDLCTTTEDHQKLDFLIGFFLHECPSSMIPSKEDVLKWAEALERRGGVLFSEHAASCRDWIK